MAWSQGSLRGCSSFLQVWLLKSSQLSKHTVKQYVKQLLSGVDDGYTKSDLILTNEIEGVNERSWDSYIGRKVF